MARVILTIFLFVVIELAVQAYQDTHSHLHRPKCTLELEFNGVDCE